MQAARRLSQGTTRAASASKLRRVMAISRIPESSSKSLSSALRNKGKEFGILCAEAGRF